MLKRFYFNSHIEYPILYGEHTHYILFFEWLNEKNG